MEDAGRLRPCAVLLLAGLTALSLVKACNEEGAEVCLEPLSTYDTFDWGAASDTAKSEACSLIANALDCLETNLEGCTNPAANLTAKQNSTEATRDAHCGADVLRVTWPLCFALLVFSFRQLFDAL